MKKTISLLLTLVMMLSFCPVAVFAAGEDEALLPPELSPEASPAVTPEAAEEAVEAEEEAPEQAQTQELPGTGDAPADGDGAVVSNGPFEPVALPMVLDGAGESVTVKFYDNAGTTLIASESVTAGYSPKAAVGPYVTVGEKKMQILGFVGQAGKALADLDAEDVLMPYFKAVSADTDYYAVYAPEEAGVAYLSYYLSHGSDKGFTPIYWSGLALNGTDGKPDKSTIPQYMLYSVGDGEGGSHTLYMTLSWYGNDGLSGEALSPDEIVHSGNTVYYGQIGSEFFCVRFEDKDGELLAFYPIEKGKTVGAYPDGDKTLPEGEFWQDKDGKVYSADEIKELAVTADLTLAPFEGYTVTYKDVDGDTISTETVTYGSKPAEVPLFEDKDVRFSLFRAIDNSIPYIWYSTEAAAQDRMLNDTVGAPVDPGQQTITADTTFYAALDGGSIDYYSEFYEEGSIHYSFYAGQRVTTFGEAREGFHTARWVDEDGEAVDVLNYVSDGTNLKLYAVDGIKVSYYFSDTKIAGELVPSGQKPLLVPENQFIPGEGTTPWQLLPITGWVDKDGKEVDPAAVTITGETSFYAANGQLDGFTVTYLDADGRTVLGTETVAEGGSPVNAPDKNGSNKAITNWLNAAGSFVNLAALTPGEDISLTAWYSPGLNSEDHIAYINGYGNAEFGPQDNLTRAQAAKIIFTLLEDSAAGPYSASFTDVKSSSWYYEPVTVLASHKILTGYAAGDGSYYFNPNESITRAEFVTILSRLFPMGSGSCDFTDVRSGSWYYNAVATAVEKGWVTGYKNDDGSYYFNPNVGITRAEAVTVVNRVLGRQADLAAINETERLIYIDVSPSSWAFGSIMEASVSHEHQSDASGETWTDFTLPACGLKAGLRNRGGKLYYVDAEDLCLMRFQPGLNKLPDGKTYYVDKDGCVINQYAAGIQELGGKLYYVQNDYSVRTQRYMTGYDTPVYEYNGKMYYVKEDFSLARNETIGYLYFGADGAYTSGDAELDALCYDFISDIIRDSSKTQKEKLSSAYYYVRDVRDSTGTKSLFSYKNYGASVSNWYLDACAKRMLQTKKGECYHWASMMVHLIRRLGYDAYRQAGTIWDGTRAHAWEIIVWPDGSKNILDVEMEWGYYWGHYIGGTSWRYDCYLVSLNITDKGNPYLPWAPYEPN